MAYTITAPKFSFLQFSESNFIESLSHPDALSCLPIYEYTDLAFQVIIKGTEAEADNLCGLGSSLVRIGIVKDCGEDFLVEFSDTPQLFKLSTTEVLMNWPHGLPGFDEAIRVNECFLVKLLVDGTPFCSTCLTRIRSDRYTSVIEYGSEENSFGFNYCGGVLVGEQEVADCTPIEVQFFNQSIVNIPYTASLRDKFGDMPSVKVWIYNTSGELQDMGVQVTMDGYPPNNISIDMGGPASGIIKIS